MNHNRDHIITNKVVAFLTTKIVGPVQVWHAGSAAAITGILYWVL